MTTTDLHSLTELLTTPTDRPLTTAERNTLTAALTELITAQRTIDTLSRALASHEEDAGAIERLARTATTSATAHAGSDSPLQNHDPSAAQRAREALLASARAATDAREIISLALRFVRTITSAI